MTQVSVKYNPYKMETEIKINGKNVSTDSSLYKFTKGKRLQEWVGNFPDMLKKELNTMTFSLEFCGMELDWDDFQEALTQAQKAGRIKVTDMKYIAGKSDEDVTRKIVQIFEDLRNGPIDDFRDPRLAKAFASIQNAVFPVNVIATMSSGKSTLVNALLRQQLMPAKNEACTATITEILDTDTPDFAAVAYDENDVVLQEIPRLTHEIMKELNENAQVQRIKAEGDIPFLDAKDMALSIVDTPGPNNAQNQAHKNMTYREINNDANNLILYVLNATQLKTNDDASLLKYVADQIKKGGKQVRDRFLFVVNKMDEFDPDKEDIGQTLQKVRQYLAAYGIEDPQLYPCSAFAALHLRTDLAALDIDNLTQKQRSKLPNSTRSAITMAENLLYSDALHLEKYSTLSPSEQQKLEYRLQKAVEADDTKEQALIHSGICSLEAAITAYVKKYAKTKRVKDLVESFQEVLESSKVLVKAKEQVATDEQAAKVCAERAAAMRRKIVDGKEAQAFKAQIEALDPMPALREKSEQLTTGAAAKVTRIFSPYGEYLTNRDEAKHLVRQFSIASSDAMAELTAELESAINHQIVDTGEQLLMEYQEKLTRFDDASEEEVLDFQTVDLIKGALNTMRESAETWTSDEFAAETVEGIGETTYEKKTYYEKVGQQEKEVIIGSHQEKIGTRKVKSGSHQEKVGTRRVKKPGIFAAIARLFGGGYTDEDVYEKVDDYKEEDVYETVLDYKKIMEDVFEEKTETIEKFSVEVTKIERALLARMRSSLEEGLNRTMDLAEEQVKALKVQFADLFEELDTIIAAKYDELERYAADETEKANKLQKNQELLNWIQTNLEEIDTLLAM